ncbi:MAG: hypothetical protein ACI9PP_000179 [Halobacteriales archaeon]|jgi:hypothetical protein
MTGYRLPDPTYRRLDRASKLAGIALLALALEAGLTVTGLGLAAAGIGLGLITIFIDTQ